MCTTVLRAGFGYATLFALGLLASPYASAADVSNGTALRHSGQIHTHRGHHASKKAAPSTAAPAATQDSASQPNAQAPAR